MWDWSYISMYFNPGIVSRWLVSFIPRPLDSAAGVELLASSPYLRTRSQFAILPKLNYFELQTRFCVYAWDYTFPSVSVEDTASIFRADIYETVFHRNVYLYVRVHRALQPRTTSIRQLCWGLYRVMGRTWVMWRCCTGCITYSVTSRLCHSRAAVLGLYCVYEEIFPNT